MPNKFDFHRPTWAEINLTNLEYNLKQIKKPLAPSVKVLACVKADAYGHGLIPVSRRLVSEGVNYLGVASVDEGVKLRQAGVKAPILILGMTLGVDAEVLIKYDFTATVCAKEFVYALNRSAARRRKRAKVHLKVDTGMGRLGIIAPDALELAKEIRRMGSVDLEGIFTHLSCADTDEIFTLRQIGTFKKILSDLEAGGIHIPLAHCANSMAIFAYKESHFNMVRPGLALYGLYPKEGLGIRLKPVLSLKTRIVYVKNVPQGWGISYGRTYVTKKPTTIAVLAIGYGDGYPRNLSGIGPVLINGKPFKISGRICMDQIMVDVGGLKIKVGDEAMLIGRQGHCGISAEELALLSGTIPYEIVCGLGSRIPRVYNG